MRTHAAAFLAGVVARPNSPKPVSRASILGTTHCFAGEYAEAREHLERALTLFEPGRDHFTEAGLDDLAIEWWGKAGDQALRR